MPLGQPFQTQTAKISQFDLAYKHQRSTSRAVDGSFYALIKAMPNAATEGGFSTPNSEVRRGNVAALAEVKGGHCKSMKCDIAVRKPSVENLRNLRNLIIMLA